MQGKVCAEELFARGLQRVHSWQSQCGEADPPAEPFAAMTRHLKGLYRNAKSFALLARSSLCNRVVLPPWPLQESKCRAATLPPFCVQQRARFADLTAPFCSRCLLRLSWIVHALPGADAPSHEQGTPSRRTCRSHDGCTIPFEPAEAALEPLGGLGELPVGPI